WSTWAIMAILRMFWFMARTLSLVEKRGPTCAAPGRKARPKARAKKLARKSHPGSHGLMPAEPAPAPKPVRIVTADTLMVAPAVLGRPLAEPGQRLAGMAIDLAAIGALSWLAKPFLGLATGV